MEIIVQGRKIDTKDIYDIVDISTSRKAGFLIKLVEKEDVEISKHIPYERTPMEIRQETKPYDNLRISVYNKWQEDKTNLEIFKI